MSESNELASSEVGNEVEAAPMAEESANTDKTYTQDEVNVEKGKFAAGLKKTYREKGYNEGYQKALQEQQANVPKEFQSESVREENVTPTYNAPPLSSQGNNISPQEVREYEKAQEVRRRALPKYDDFEKKVMEFSQKSQYDPELKMLLQHAVSIGNEDTVYKVLSDPDARKSILDKNPRLWEKELLKIGANKKAPVVIKNAFPPLDETTAPNPSSEESSRNQRHKWARDRLNGRC